jgi:hypothetical protein
VGDLEKNRSGFDRIKIPVPEEFTDRIAQVRVNFFPPNIKPSYPNENSVHSHPFVFDSLIVQGQYTQLMYDYSFDGEPTHIYYHVGAEDYLYKKPMIQKIQPVRLALQQSMTAKAGTILEYSRDIIHDIADFIPNSCTVNVLYWDTQDNCPLFSIFKPINSTENIIFSPYIPAEEANVLWDQLLECLSHPVPETLA